ncbi:MAG: twin-arginine translocase TatA/TatE family subunit [Olsenella sp.]|jgi:sec-independent protein translocase protein TatA|nr:twin-arginine translocase TatA/TatE family subunit [Olsenella sp.]MCI1288541.1 twin-arginine translocase TatA/TatE family subunit [Olsenella sp.]
MILGMGAPELILIVLVCVVLFGPKNLPKLGTALGQTVKNVREGMEETPDEKSDAMSQATTSQDAAADSNADTDAATKTCPNCGATLAADAAFCSHCGHKLEA